MKILSMRTCLISCGNGLQVMMCLTVAFMNWGGVKNGRLLENAAANGFDLILTVDAGIQHQQNLTALRCSVIIIRAESNAMKHIEPLVDQILLMLQTLERHSLVTIG